MTSYYLVYSNLKGGSLGNFRSHNEEFIDALDRGMRFELLEIHNETLESGGAKILQVVELENKSTPQSVIEYSNETIDTRELAIRIAKEKSAHASVVSKAYDTGEATSMAAYTDEIEDVICRTLEAIKPVEKTLFEEFPEVLEEYKKAATERMNQMPSSFDDVVIPTRTFNHADFKCVVCGSTRKLSFPGEPARVQYCPTCELNTMYQLDDAVWGKKRGLEALVTTDRETDLIRSVQDLLERRIRSGTSTLELKEIQKLLEDSE